MAFFHIHAINRRQRNHICRLRKGDVVAPEPKDMEEMATDHFTELLEEPAAREFTLNLNALDLPSVKTTTLEFPFS
jgi:hypothetical protein